ncbi:MAG: efflux RND transporter periplasmic adaptor subunit [Anaerolineae bacterium]
MRKFLRWIVIIAVLIAIVAAAAAVIRSQPGDTAPAAAEIIDEAEVRQGELSVTISGTGAVMPARQVPLLFEASGTIAEILVHEGDRVATGDVIARLDTTDLENSLAEAQLALDQQQIAYDALSAPPRDVDVASAQAALDLAQASLNASYDSSSSDTQAALAAVQADLARNRLWQAQLQRDLAANPSAAAFGLDITPLIPDGVDLTQEQIDRINQTLNSVVSMPSVSTGSAGQFDSSLTQAEYGVEIADANASAAASRPGDVAGIAQAQASVVQAQVAIDRLMNGASDDDLHAAQIGLQQAQLAIDQASVALDRALLVAPFDGVIAQSFLTIGETPPTQDPAVILIDDSAYYVDLAVDETDIVKVEVDQPVELSIDALPDTPVTGHVNRVAVAPTVIGGQLVTYPVRITIDTSDAPIRIGMSATATVLVNRLTDVLIIPNRFVRIDRNSGQAYVTVEDPVGVFAELPVELGLRGDTESQIISGVEAGQRVVLVPRAQFNLLNGPPR